MNERAQWVLWCVCVWLLVAWAIAGCAPLPLKLGAEAEVGALARPGATAFDPRLRSDAVAATEREAAAAELARMRQMCLFFPAKEQLRCVMLHL